MKITGNEPAWPVNLNVLTANDSLMSNNGTEIWPTGLTIRQQFAMAAMQWFIASPKSYNTMREIAEKSVEMADALIAELNRTEAANV